MTFMTHRFVLTLLFSIAIAPVTSLQADTTFRKQVLTTDYLADGIHAADVDRDGKMDIIAGPYWYVGPDFKTRYEFFEVTATPPEAHPSNSMFSFVHDFNGDGWMDILVLGRVHKHKAYWYENPGDANTARSNKHWKQHLVFERVRGESPTLVDLDGDGQPQIICHWENKWGWIEPVKGKPTWVWNFVAISKKKSWNQFYHGMGAGDVNGDGKLDLMINDGWYEQPAKPRAAGANDGKVDQLWPFHAFKFGEAGGAQMFAYDVDGDKDNDIITALNAHLWGLAWFETTITERNESIQFLKHPLMGDRTQEKQFGVAFSQPHAMTLGDINGDGLKDIIVGKRRWAHGPKGDVEPNAAAVVYWFELKRDKKTGKATFIPHLIDDNSGVGVQIQAIDVTGDGKLDVLTTSKLGAFLFVNGE